MDTEISLAIRAAHRSSSNRFRIGASARRKDGAIVAAHNATDRIPYPRGHAEIRLARKLDVGSVVIVVRVRRDGRLAMAKPCQNCLRSLLSVGVAEIYYSNHDGEIVKLSLREECYPCVPRYASSQRQASRSAYCL